MEDKIKEIVSVFIKVPAGDIGSSTPVDRTAVKSSILLHRMYARLAEAGYRTENYAGIANYGELLQACGKSVGGNSRAGAPAGTAASVGRTADGVVSDGPIINADASFSNPLPFQGSAVTSAGPSAYTDQPGIGIDIEEAAAMPRCSDFRREEFYTMNFTPGEIAYCILQPDSYASFAGLFSAKEALIKADANLRTRPFNTIEVGHNPEGKPVYPGFQLSISHAGHLAVAVAVPAHQQSAVNAPAPTTLSNLGPVRQKSGWIGWLAVLLAILSIVLNLTR